MTGDVRHRRIRETQDRSWTFALLEHVRAGSTPDAATEETFRTLADLDDYRSTGPLTAMVENAQLPGPTRRAASQVLRVLDDTTTSARRRAWWASGDSENMAHALRLMERPEADIVVAVAGDDSHPLQSLALEAMAFGFDEPDLQPVKIRALDHPNSDVREAAADVLLWDEPVAARKSPPRRRLRSVERGRRRRGRHPAVLPVASRAPSVGRHG